MPCYLCIRAFTFNNIYIMLNLELGGAIASGAANLLGGIFGGLSGASASKYAADRQLQATIETNKMNAQLAREQRDWEYKMVQEQNAYNSLAAQRHRAEEAGFSPYILGGQNSNLQNQIPSYQRAEMQTPDMSQYQQYAQLLGNTVPQSLTNAFNSFAQTLQAGKSLAEQKAINIENVTRSASAVAELQRAQEEARGSALRNIAQDLQNQFSRDSYKYRLQRETLENENIAQSYATQWAQEMYTRSLVNMNHHTLKYFDQRQQLELAQISANVALSAAQSKLTNAQTKLAIENSIFVQLRQKGQMSENECRKVAAAYSDNMNWELLKNIRERTRNIGSQTDFLPVQIGLDALGTVGGLIPKF